MTDQNAQITDNQFENTNETLNALIDCLAALSEQLIVKGITPPDEITSIFDDMAAKHFEIENKDASKAIWQLVASINGRMSLQALKHIPPSGQG